MKAIVEHCPLCGDHVVVVVTVTLAPVVLAGEGECVVPQVDYEAAIHKCRRPR